MKQNNLLQSTGELQTEERTEKDHEPNAAKPCTYFFVIRTDSLCALLTASHHTHRHRTNSNHCRSCAVRLQRGDLSTSQCYKTVRTNLQTNYSFFLALTITASGTVHTDLQTKYSFFLALTVTASGTVCTNLQTNYSFFLALRVTASGTVRTNVPPYTIFYAQTCHLIQSSFSPYGYSVR